MATTNSRDMIYPAYVPAVVRQKLGMMIQESYFADGYAFSPDKLELQIREIEAEITAHTASGNVDDQDKCRQEISQLYNNRRRLNGRVDCLKRLVFDPRMKDAYALLAAEFTDDEQWITFLVVAWTANTNYTEYRDRLNFAKELKDEIAVSSEKLAKLLIQMGQLLINSPVEFLSTEMLLDTTHKRDISSELNSRGERYHFFPALLKTLAEVARKYEPSENEMVDMALDSRQRSVKSEYLRGLIFLFLENNKFSLTKGVMKAIALAAEVVIDQNDIEVTYDDVRKVVSKLECKLAENS